MPYENPEGRRVNVLATLTVDGSAPALHWVGYAGTWRGEHLVRLCEQLLDAHGPVGLPIVVVLDNASIHRARVVRDALPAFAARGLTLFYLPPYSPELNAIERVFRAIKHTHLPERRYTTLDALHAAIDTAFTDYEQHLHRKLANYPGLAA
jgi:transposase